MSVMETSKEVWGRLKRGSTISFQTPLRVYGADEGTWTSTGKQYLIVEEGKLRTPTGDAEFLFERIPSGQTFRIV